MKKTDSVSKIGGYITARNLVHAYAIAGGRDTAQDEILTALESEFNIQVKGNPDVHVVDLPSMGIDDARVLYDLASKRPLSGEKKFFVLTFNSITREAQNALLKLFEEPTEGTHFFLIIPSHDILLPTLLSRLFLLSIESGDLDEMRAKKFIEASLKERLLLIKDIVEAKDKAAAIVFLNELEAYIYKTAPLADASPDTRASLKDIEKARSYLTDRAPSVKMLLEQVSLAIPHKQ